MCLDGPTFVATEGWDWIPAIRDRDTGIWQQVTLTATREVKIEDPQVVTSLPLPDTSRADVEIMSRSKIFRVRQSKENSKPHSATSRSQNKSHCLPAKPP